jgi:hypothetical protein
MFHPGVNRLPVWPEAYVGKNAERIPDYFPQPYSADKLGSYETFDAQSSQLRYKLVDSLFDVMVTYRFEELQSAVEAMHDAEQQLRLSRQPQPEVASALVRARDLLNYMSVDEEMSRDPGFTGKFTKSRKKAEDEVPGEQGGIEGAWDAAFNARYQRAAAFIREALEKAQTISVSAGHAK